MKSATSIRPRSRPLLLAAVLAATLSGVVGLINLSSTARSEGPQTVAGAHEFAGPVSFADVIARVNPAVVDITVEQVASVMPTGRPQLQVPGQGGSSLDDFLGRFFGSQGLGQPPAMQRREALGTGFVIDPDGYIVTNNHVIDGADEVTVRFRDGDSYKATVVGRDPKTDLALLKIDAHHLAYVKLGDSDKVRAGDWVLAIGNPFGLGGSATAGIVSARGRDIQSGPYDDYLQIDAAINGGNSGGPVFNAEGEVIGISTAIITPNGGNIGIGFAIPSNQAEAVIEPLKEHGTVSRGWLGVQIQDVDNDLAAALDVGDARGALVVTVEPGSPAAKAGLEDGDLITNVGDQKVEDSRQLARLVASHQPGDKLALGIVRDGHSRDIDVSLGDAGSHSGATAPRELSSSNVGKSQYGLELGDLTATDRQNLGLPDDVNGALVTGVAPDGPAADKGLEAGDVIVQVNRHDVDSASAALAALSRSEGHRALLLVRRGDDRRFVAIGPAA